MTIEESRSYIENKHWHINEASFKVIEEETCAWVAEATMSDGYSFFVLVQGLRFFTIEKHWRHTLGAWFNEHL